jgi:RNA polymerase sigma-70 factor (ECF subfamily)
MTLAADADTERLLTLAERGDPSARDRLLGKHRDRLVRAVARRLDRRIAARVDASDVVQDALADADRKLPGYLRDRPLPFYPWLRQLALERLVRQRRHHVGAQMRAVGREGEAGEEPVTVAGPVADLLRSELRARVRDALAELPPNDREVLRLRHLEGRPVREVAGLLGLTDGAVKVRHLRALRRFRDLLRREEGSSA